MIPAGCRTIGCMIIAASAVGCREDAPPTPTAPRATRDVIPRKAIGNISFDFTLTSAPSAPGGTGSATFHVERVAASATGSRTTIAIIDKSARAAAIRASWSPTRLEVDERGVITVRRADGSVMQPPALDQLATSPLVRGYLNRKKLAPVSPANAFAASHTPGTHLPTNWAETFVRTQAECAGEVAALKRTSAFDHHDAAGNDHYLRANSRSTVEAVVDPRKNVVIRLSIVVGDTLTSVTSDYVDGPEGLKIRRQMQATRTTSGGTTPTNQTRTTTITLSNVNLDGQEVVR